MSVECVHPEDLPEAEHFSHVVVASQGRLVFIAGQVSEDAQGDVVGLGDMVAQSRQVFANIGRALAAAGARPEDVTKLTIFVANYRREYIDMIEEGRRNLFVDHKPADTLVGVEMLSRPEYMLEVDAIAVVSHGCLDGSPLSAS